jgi:hypothetical protein
MANKKRKKETEKITEVFKIEDADGKTKKEIVKDIEIKKEHASKTQVKKQEKQLRNILIVLGVVVLFVVLIFLWMKLIRIVYYEDVKFETVQEGQLILYNTKIPVYDATGKHSADHEFYLRTNPKDLEKVPFDGNLVLRKGYTINVTEEFNCGGYGAIAFANLIRQHEIIGIAYINDKNATCDGLNKYNYYEIKSGNETKMVQRGDSSCYDIHVRDCEILPATEKIMAEVFSEFNKL